LQDSGTLDGEVLIDAGRWGVEVPRRLDVIRREVALDLRIGLLHRLVARLLAGEVPTHGTLHPVGSEDLNDLIILHAIPVPVGVRGRADVDEVVPGESEVLRRGGR